MTYEILRDYKRDCEKYKWKPSIKGLVAYHRQVQLGLRELWAK